MLENLSIQKFETIQYYKYNKWNRKEYYLKEEL